MEEEVVETGPMKDGCINSVFTHRSWTDLLSFFLLFSLELPVFCHREELIFFVIFSLFLLSSHLKVITKGFIYVINHFLFMPVEELL